MSETEEPQPQKDKIPFVPGQPLPRLWKTEPEPEEDSEESLEDPDKKKAPKNQAVAAPASKSASKSYAPVEKPAKPKPAKPKPAKKKASEGEKGEKRVLLEETPKFDTIESRHRARLIMGGLIAFCIFIMAWNVYRLLFAGSGELTPTIEAVEMPTGAPALLPGPAPSREPEANYMLERARDYAKRGQTKDALRMLKQVVSVYRGTQAAGEAQAALDRPKQNLPLFPAGPFVLAEKKAVDPSRPPASANPPTSATGPGSGAVGSPPNPRTVTAPPPQVTMVGPPPGYAQPSAGPTGPGSSMNPGTVGPAPAPALPMNPNATNTGPPPAPAHPASSTSSPLRVRPRSTGTVAVAPSATQPPAQAQSQPQPPPPPGPGEAVLLIPANKGNTSVTAPAGDRRGLDANPTTAMRPAERMLPPGFKPVREAGLHESGWWRVIVGERDNGKMVLVSGATFLMGQDGGSPEDGPAHSVRLSTYYIDQYEVTNRQFRIFLEETHYHGQPPGKWMTDEKLRALPDNAPAVFVSYHDAESYAIWALKRLPTEAQWELAARSVDGRRYPWGDQPVRWGRERKFRQIDPVMSFPEDVSPYGVRDMAGNAWEWVRDWYDPRYFDRLRDKTTEDPSGPPSKRRGIQRTVRGGSKDWLVFDRQGIDSDTRAPYLGFRCSLAVEGGEASANIVPPTGKPEKPSSPQPGGQPAGETVPF